MELELNFKFGQKTVNGRYYDPHMLSQQFDDFLQIVGEIPVGPDSKEIDHNNGIIPEDKIVGKCVGYVIKDDGTVIFDVQEMSEPTENFIINNPGVIKLSIFGFGNMNENKTVYEFKLTSLFMTMDS